MVKARKLYTLDEAAGILGVARDDIMKLLPRCAPDFATRSSKRLTQEEVDCCAKALGKGK